MLLQKILLGITLAAPIGPVSIEMIKRGLDKGFFGAFVVRLGGAIGNTLCLIAAYFGTSLLVTSSIKMGLCSIAGALILFYLGIKALLDKRAHFYQADAQLSATANQKNTLSSGLLTGFVLSIANPIGLAFWFTIFAVPSDVGEGTTVWLGLLQNFAVIAGVLIWGGILSGILEVGKKFIRPKWIKGITKVAGIMLIYFGSKYAYRGIELVMMS